MSKAPLWAQNDPRWAAEEYDHSLPQGNWCGATIGQCGCAMSSVATVLSLFKVLTLPDGTELNPQTLNQWFNRDARLTSGGWVSQGYVYGAVVWTAANALSAQVAAARPGTPTVRVSGWGSGSESEVRTELGAGRPLVLEVPGHFIAAVGLEGTNILINDPFYRDRTTLNAYAGLVRSSRRFEASQNLSAVVISVPSEARVRVTDSQGRVTGTLASGDPQQVGQQAPNDIPGSVYRFEEAWRDPTCTARAPAPGQGVNTVVILSPGKESLRIKVVSPQGGGTSVAIHAYDTAGKSTLETRDAPGDNDIELDYDPTPGGTMLVRPLLSPPSPTITASPTSSPAPRPTVTPTPTSGPGPAPTATSTPPPTSTPPSTATPTPTSTSTPPSTATPTPTPTSTLTSTPTPSPTPTVSPPSTPTRTPTSTPTPCPTLTNAEVGASRARGSNDVTVTWRSSGGCAPFAGTVTARYADQARPYASYPLATQSGTLTDRPPTRCEGTFTVVYTLSLRDRFGQSVTATATISVTWLC